MSWNLVELGTICDITNGSTPLRTNPDFWENGTINWFTIEDIRRFGREVNQTTQFVTEKALRETSLKIVPANTVLLCCTASVGEFAITKIPLAMNQQFNGLILKTDKVIPEFLFHYSSTLKDKLISVSGSTTINFVAISKLKKITIPIPSLQTQKKLVTKLEAIFAEIDKATAAAEANVKSAEALFQSCLSKVFNENYETSKKLKDCCLIKPPKSELRNVDNSLDVSFMPMEALGINLKNAIPNQTRKLSEVSGSYTYFAEGDILLAKITPCFENGKLGIAKDLRNKIGFGSSEYVVFRPTDEVDSSWLYYYLNRNEFRMNGAKHMAGAVGHKRVTKEFIEESELPLPPLTKQKELVSYIESIFNVSKSLEISSLKKSNELKKLKQSILKQAFSGELIKE